MAKRAWTEFAYYLLPAMDTTALAAKRGWEYPVGSDSLSYTNVQASATTSPCCFLLFLFLIQYNNP